MPVVEGEGVSEEVGSGAMGSEGATGVEVGAGVGEDSSGEAAVDVDRSDLGIAGASGERKVG